MGCTANKCWGLFLSDLKQSPDMKTFLNSYRSSSRAHHSQYPVFMDQALKSGNSQNAEHAKTIRLFLALLDEDINRAYESIAEIEFVATSVENPEEDSLEKHFAPREFINQCLKEENPDLRESYIKLMLVEAQKSFSKARNKVPNFTYLTPLKRSLDQSPTSSGAKKRNR